MTKLHSARIISKGFNNTSVFLDGKELTCRNLTLHIARDEITELNVTLLCGEADVVVCDDDNDAMDNQES